MAESHLQRISSGNGFKSLTETPILVVLRDGTTSVILQLIF